MKSDDVPVVLSGGTVVYVSPETPVTWPGALQSVPVSLIARGAPEEVYLPNGRRGFVEGWKDEALRLREESHLRRLRIERFSAKLKENSDLAVGLLIGASLGWWLYGPWGAVAMGSTIVALWGLQA